MQVNVEAPSEHVCSSSTVESINVYSFHRSAVTKSLLLFYNLQPILLNVNIYYIYIYIVYSDYSEFLISITLKGLLISPS